MRGLLQISASNQQKGIEVVPSCVCFGWLVVGGEGVALALVIDKLAALSRCASSVRQLPFCSSRTWTLSPCGKRR